MGVCRQESVAVCVPASQMRGCVESSRSMGCALTRRLAAAAAMGAEWLRVMTLEVA